MNLYFKYILLIFLYTSVYFKAYPLTYAEPYNIITPYDIMIQRESDYNVLNQTFTYIEVGEKNGPVIYKPFSRLYDSFDEYALLGPYDPEEGGDPVGVIPVDDSLSFWIIAVTAYLISKFKKNRWKKYNSKPQSN